MNIRQAEEVRYWSCERKQGFTHPSEAHRSGPGKRGARPYRCPFCLSFHVGHVPSMQTLRQLAKAIRVLHQKADA